MRTPLLQIFLIMVIWLAWPGSALGQNGGDAGAEGGAMLADSILAAMPDSALALLPDSVKATLPDSILARLPEDDASAAEDSIPRSVIKATGFRPQFTSSTKSSDINYKIDNEMKVNMMWPDSSRLGGRVYFNRDLPREVKREKLDSGFNINTGLVAWDAVPLDLRVSRSLNRNEQNKGEENYRRDDTERQGLNMAARSSRKLGSWFRLNGRTSVDVSQTTTDNTLGLKRKTVDNRKNYGSSLDFIPTPGVKVVTGYSGTYTTGTGELVGYTDDVVSTQDSLQMKVTYRVGSKVSLSMSGGMLESTSERLDFLRDQYGLIVSVAGEDSIPVTEETNNSNWGTNFSVDFKFGKFMDLKTTLGVKEEQKRVTNSLSKDKDANNTDLNIGSNIRPWGGQRVKLDYKQKVAETVDTNADKRREVRELLVESTQEFNQSFKISGDAHFALSQDLYADRVKNPQDMDKAQTRFSLHVIGKPTEWLTVDNAVLWYNKQDIQIDASRSVASKDENTLTWKAKADYAFWEKYKLIQFYEVSVIEDDFYFTKDKNSLDREYLLITESPRFPLWRFLTISLKHEFRLREEGSYLPDPEADNVKTFFRDTRRKTEKLELSASYAYRKYLNISVREEVSREIEYDYSDESESSSFFGTLNFNLKFDQPLGKGGSATFTLLHRARFGKFVRDDQRRVWLPTLGISYTF